MCLTFIAVGLTGGSETLKRFAEVGGGRIAQVGRRHPRVWRCWWEVDAGYGLQALRAVGGGGGDESLIIIAELADLLLLALAGGADTVTVLLGAVA